MSIVPGRGILQGCPYAPVLSKLTMLEPMQTVAALPMVEHCDLWLDDVSLDVTGTDPVEVASAAQRSTL